MDISKRIALILKELRKERRWSLDKTSAETGVSKAMLGQIEREESSPTVATLWKIAKGFQISFSPFLEDTEVNEDTIIHRSGVTHNISPKNKEILVSPIFPFDKTLHCEMFVIDLLPGCVHQSPPHEKGVVEHVIAVDGGLEVLLTDNWHLLGSGEGLKFNANQSHGYRNLTSSRIRFHNVIHYPQSQASEKN